MPFATGWMGENHFAAVPTAVYGGVFLAAAIAYYVLERTLIRAEGPLSQLKVAVGRDLKGKSRPCSTPRPSFSPSCPSGRRTRSLYVVVALIWLVPDRPISPGSPNDSRPFPETRRGVPA